MAETSTQIQVATAVGAVVGALFGQYVEQEEESDSNDEYVVRR